ncbi:D(2) dopamine receptor, partial [Biomphalaria glabrata]
QSTKDGELREVEGRQNNIQLTVVAAGVRFQSPNGGVNELHQIYPALNTEIHPALATSVEADHEENLDVLNQIQTRRKFLRQQRNLRVTSLLFVITAIFILSWMAPYAAMVKGLYVGFRYPLSLGDLVLVMYGPNIYVINTFSNPLVYAILSPSYRKL